MRAEHHLRMLDEILVDADRALVFGRTANLCEVEPGIISGGFSSRRFRKNRMSTTTSVPASVRKLPSGRRIAPTRSAVAAMCVRALASALLSGR